MRDGQSLQQTLDSNNVICIMCKVFRYTWMMYVTLFLHSPGFYNCNWWNAARCPRVFLFWPCSGTCLYHQRANLRLRSVPKSLNKGLSLYYPGLLHPLTSSPNWSCNFAWVLPMVSDDAGCCSLLTMWCWACMLVGPNDAQLWYVVFSVLSWLIVTGERFS